MHVLAVALYELLHTFTLVFAMPRGQKETAALLKKCEPKLRDIAPAESKGHIFGTGDDSRPQAEERCRVFRISQTHAVCRRYSGTSRSSAGGLHAILLGHQLGHKLPVTKRLRITSKYLVLLAEGEELETNLLQASQRGPASSSVLDEVFGTHNGPYFDIGGKRATARAYRRALASCGLRSPGILREVQHQ
jgi:hypothetical protein